MVRNYLANAAAPKPGEGNAAAPTGPNPLRELQAQWGKMLTRCYELHAEGQRCAFEEDPLKRFDCSHCEHREADHFCRSNFYLKKLVGLIAEHLASREGTNEGIATDATPEADEAAPLTQAQIDEFKAQGVCYEVETSLCKEHVWIVPRRTGKQRLELTCEEILSMSQAARTLEGALVEIRRESPSQPSGEPK